MVHDSDEVGRYARLNLPFRLALAVLFASCGIWILAFSLGWLREPIPVTSKWAWSTPATLVFFRLAAAVWLGFNVTPSYGIHGEVVADCIFAAFYFATSAAILMRERLGVALAFVISLISTAVLAQAAESYMVHPRSRVSALDVGVTTAAALGYLVLSCLLGKPYLPLWKSQWKRMTKPPTAST